MSRFNLIKISLIAVFIFLPAQAAAETFGFEGKTWEIEVQFGETAEPVALRQDQSLFYTVQLALFDKRLENPVLRLEDSTITQIEALATEINQPANNARVVLKDNRVQEFDPGQNGQAVDLYQLLQTIYARQSQPDLPVVIIEPEINLPETNSLGINELVAVGESDFTGSPYNRRVNIRVGADKYNGLIIKPGAEFSFNKFLGDVDAANGFLPELVIKATGVVPEFGGGLCQVSSTVFRAAMNAGLHITERRNHSFAVQYYAPQGTDATIYPGATDLRFVNDLASHILIRTRIEGSKLYFEFYGTKDARSVAFEGPFQYDKKTDGSMKATWTRHVTQNGEITTQVFNSTYQPPARFYKEAVSEASTPNPESQPEQETESETPAEPLT